jgi:putative transcriptional regulator
MPITIHSQKLCFDPQPRYGFRMLHGTSLGGKLLIAMPRIRDSNFDHSVVFLCAHSDQGAMGLVINKPAPLMYFADLLDKIELDGAIEDIPEDVLRVPVRLGGPVEQFRGFVLHSEDYMALDQTLAIGKEYGLTATVDILRDIAAGRGPKKRLVALGYAGWAPGQLEDEIQHNGWLHCEPDEDIIFGDILEDKHHVAMKKIGVDPGMLSADFGHA